ncbi:DUF6932 family protein [Zhihengliuella flava]|uniref:Uncharacterized protein n=1 Tax=Zhihengliuella flava TaxID=1285193 RepID=A0A931GGJ3_9MICC|nr:hypothetical protein [Zhihengliuella flava]MBG6085862.1 hypothetical protein [Zhihengliuella flava]
MEITVGFDTPTGFLPPGRYSCDHHEARQFLVGAPRFDASETRDKLWDGLEGFLAEFVELERKYESELSVPLLDRIWLGGSFVSTKINPRNVDLTLFLNDDAVQELRGRPGAGILKKSRRDWLARYSVSPLFVHYRPIISIFRNDGLSSDDTHYLIERGKWDDWWQRCREDSTREPTLESARTKRGYLEVTL